MTLRSALHLVLLVVAVTGVVLALAGRTVGGAPSGQAVRVGGALAVVSLVATAVAWAAG